MVHWGISFSECLLNFIAGTLRLNRFSLLYVFNWLIFTVVKMWSLIALYKYLRYQWFNLQLLLEATSATFLMLHICHRCVNTVNVTLSQPIWVALYLTVTHCTCVLHCHALYMCTWLSRTLYVYLTVTHSICVLAALHVHRIEIPCRAFPERA